MNPLASYIDKEVRKGFSRELITEKLKQANYNHEEITDAFHDYETQLHYGIQPIEKKHHSHLFLIIIIILGVVFGLLIASTALQDEIKDIMTSKKEITTEHDCRNLEFKQKEQCLMQLAALYNNTLYCTNITSKVMKYECKTQVWNKNPCNYLILTDQPSC
jgi:hypothetical protein